MSFIVA